MGDEDDVLAAETALGVLEGEDRAAAEARRASDPAFAAAVEAWEARLAPFHEEVLPVAPSPDLWSRIEAALPRSAANDSRPAIGGWRAAALSFGGIAAALALVLVTRPATPPAPPAPPAQQQPAPAPAALIAQLPDAEGASMLAARYDQGDALDVRATAIPEGPGEPELWVIPADGAPVSLGQFARSGASRLALAPTTRALLRDGATLALTLEPAEGAPHAAPSGTILGTARLTRI
ncbi:anti-sigma factor [Sphingomonas spermidinifaciens]|nr:anti-sigma factor [Sphingomonas spermidinifaciens]